MNDHTVMAFPDEDDDDGVKKVQVLNHNVNTVRAFPASLILCNDRILSAVQAHPTAKTLTKD